MTIPAPRDAAYPAFRGSQSIVDWFERARVEMRDRLHRLKDSEFSANSDEEIANYLTQHWVLEPLEEDTSRGISASQEREVVDSVNRGTSELRYASIELPLIPRESNAMALDLRAHQWLRASELERVARFREKDHVIVVNASLNDVERLVAEMRTLIGFINEGINEWAPKVRQAALDMVRARRAQVKTAETVFNDRMQSLGIGIRARTESAAPITVEVKREIQILREPKPESPDPRLGPDEIKAIVGLIDRSGRNFEQSPEVYSSLEEEQLRDVILGNLNAMFEIPAATGETFSRVGKTDILLMLPGGAVFIAECKFWDGPNAYGKAIEQLFDYLTWRHTVASLVTFSRRKGFSSVIESAKQACSEHESFTGSIQDGGESYFISNHVHPRDSAKQLELHHLLFDLSP